VPFRILGGCRQSGNCAITASPVHVRPQPRAPHKNLFLCSLVPSFPVSVKHALLPRFRILLFPQADTSQRGRAGYFSQFATLELRAARSWWRATTFWDNLPSCPASNADADCKFFVLKISALKFLKTADLLENPTPQIAENRGIVRSPPGEGMGVGSGPGCPLTTVLCFETLAFAAAGALPTTLAWAKWGGGASS
jgi:hypothetical protein